MFKLSRKLQTLLDNQYTLDYFETCSARYGMSFRNHPQADLTENEILSHRKVGSHLFLSSNHTVGVMYVSLP